MTIGQSIALHGRAIGDLLAELTPEELRQIADYPFCDMFAWWDEKSYVEQPPMFIRGEPLSHSMARFVWLQIEIFHHQRRFAADADKPLLLPVNICFRHRRVGKPERVAKRSLRARTRIAEHQAV